ncbi:hypothetical protein ABEX25_20570 [Paenibacillus thiaminolyticus]|uniref:hypothetical protein n=1 Tax=Paenibacillus thiaminolyticus TaxID=49283 RepID=UPI003D265474
MISKDAFVFYGGETALTREGWIAKRWDGVEEFKLLLATSWLIEQRRWQHGRRIVEDAPSQCVG